MTSDSPVPPPGTAAESAEIDLGRLPRRRRSNRAETCVLVLVIAFAIGAVLLPISNIFRWDWTDMPAIRAAYARGEAAYDDGDYQTAIVAYTAALAACEYDINARFNRAQAEFAAGQFQAAILDYSWVLDHSVRDGQVDRISHLKRAQAREQVGDVMGAASDLYEIADIRPTSREAAELVRNSLPVQESYLTWWL